MTKIKSSEIAVVIPTYNESSNIKTLLTKIYKVLPNGKVYLIDDSSMEENKKLIEGVRKTNAKVVSRMQKLGRGSAVIAGFKEVLKNKDTKLIFEMDADLSHDPGEFPLFLGKMKADSADLIIGSRYLKRSKITDWPLWRLAMSRIINLFLDFLLGLRLTDYTDGFRLYNRNAAEFLTRSKFKTSGFILLSESSYALKVNNFMISEVPIRFIDRKHGESSMSIRELFISLYGILKVRFNK